MVASKSGLFNGKPNLVKITHLTTATGLAKFRFLTTIRLTLTRTPIDYAILPKLTTSGVCPAVAIAFSTARDNVQYGRQ